MSAQNVASEDLGLVATHTPVSFLDSYQAAIPNSNKTVFAYLTDSFDPANPLTDGDGFGSIFTSHRDSDSHAEMQEALGLDSDWYRDLDLVNSNNEGKFRKAWILAATDNAEFQDWCHENGRPPQTDDTLTLQAYYKRKAERFWRDTGGSEAPGYHWEQDIWNFEVTDDVRESLWADLAADGLIGDPDRVSLNVYEHSGIAFSVSGHGATCPWDTTRGGALWVPDDSARHEISRRAPVYAYGDVISKQASGKTLYACTLTGSPSITSIWFDSWGGAFETLEVATSEFRREDQDSKRWPDLLRLGRHKAAVELAREAAELYTDYCNGSVYEVVIETYETCGCCDTSNSVDVEFHGECFGSSEAEQLLKDTFESEVKRLSQDA